jgi:hypothetical protein
MTPELQRLIEDAYRLFGAYTLKDTLTACHCNCCMSEANAHLLIKTPLRDIPSPLLAEYTNSAHDWDDGPVARQMRYFLPRYLELIANDDPPDTMGLDICLRRLGQAGWRSKWPDREVALLDRFFEAFLVSSTDTIDLVEWPVGWKLRFDMTDVLTMIITARGDLRAALAAWDGVRTAGSALHLAAMRENLLQSGGRTYLHSAYLERDFDAEADAIGAFLMRDDVDRRIEAAFFMISDPRLQKILSDAMVR